ncbi:MAG: hypothetical protein GSR80_001007 [Desulfurococcales archaeon]|nr:hypothetical protein [Desulfurococcales archaeon]
MCHLILPPMGWGFMLIHNWRDQGAMVVTDGGSYPSCYQGTIRILGGLLGYDWRPRGGWAWILSHVDYDHYSIVTGLVRAGQWPTPSLVILPAVYDLQACREAVAEYHKLAVATAALLRLPPPSISDLTGITGSVERVGVSQGSRLQAGELVYHVIWPPFNSEARLKCGKLADRLRRKLDEAMRRCREKRGRACNEALERGEREAGDILDRLAPGKIVETINLDEILTKTKSPTPEEGETRRLQEALAMGSEERPVTYEYLFAEAAVELDDYELLALHGDIVNNFSLAYSLETSEYGSDRKALCASVREFYSPTTQAAPFRSLFYLVSHDPVVLLYPSDLSGDALAQALSYFKHHYKGRTLATTISVAIEVAAHHGNAFTPELRDIAPTILFFPRCNSKSRHVSPRIRGGFKYRRRFRGLDACTKIYSGHTHGLEAWIIPRCIC